MSLRSSQASTRSCRARIELMFQVARRIPPIVPDPLMVRAMDTVDPTAARPRVAIVVTGSELLTGTISDGNGPWLARQLTNLGLQVGRILVVGDRPGDLSWVLDDVAGY